MAIVAGAVVFLTNLGDAVVLPLLLFYSLIRMLVAYVFALLFAVAYGTTAALKRRASTVLLPLLDVLQSIPILAFFPAALVFFVTSFQGHAIGLELAVVFLIFTSMAWNLAFGVYEAVTTIPTDLEDATRSFGLTGWLRFRRLILPAAIPKLVDNSILSWTNGWFFLVASEVFTAFGATYVRPGIGSFLADAGARGDATAITLALAGLAGTVLLVDTLLWRPLSGWADRFRTESPRGSRARRTYEPLRWIPRIRGLRQWGAARARPLVETYERASLRLEHAFDSHPGFLRTVRRIDVAMFLATLVLVTTVGLTGIAGVFTRPLPPEAADIPGHALHSFFRLLVAYGVAVAWTVPLAVYLGRRPGTARILTPILEVFASLPATALLPVIVGFSLAVAAASNVGPELAAVLIAVFSMQWYLLFNIVGGVRGIPSDLDEAVRAFGIRGRTYWKRVLLPAIAPSFLTGTITAWGAGWNALIVSEYFRYHGQLFTVPGLGSLMDQATFDEPNGTMLLLVILTMTVVVLAMNKLLWHPLARRAAHRYRLEAA